MTTSTLNISQRRKDFPLIAHSALAYLDNAATTQKPFSVIAAERDYYETYNANVHRGVYDISERATQAYEGVRIKVAQFIGADNPLGVIYTRNTTEAINLVARAWGAKHLAAGDEIVITEMEHHSNIVPWQMMAKETGAIIKYVPFSTATASPHWEELPRLLGSKTKLVAFNHVNNSLGTINPVAEIIAAIKKLSGAKILIDGAQGVPHLHVNVQEWDCDFLAFSAHKMLGPTGIGVLYAKEGILKTMDPFLGGGDMIKEVSMERSTWNDIPWRFEAGTPNIAGVVAFGAALDYLNTIGIQAIHEHEFLLTKLALELLGAMDGVTLYGTKNAEGRCGVVSFNVNGVHPHDTGTLLAREDIAIRVGHHCNMPIMRRYGIMGTARASFYLYNTIAEVERLAAALPKIQRLFAPVKSRNGG